MRIVFPTIHHPRLCSDLHELCALDNVAPVLGDRMMILGGRSCFCRGGGTGDLSMLVLLLPGRRCTSHRELNALKLQKQRGRL